MSHIKEKLDRAFDLFDQGLLKDAETLYEACIQQLGNIDSDEYLQALHGLGYVKAALAKYDEARKLYNELMKIAQNNNQVMDHCVAVHQLGMVERMAHNYEEAQYLFSLEANLLHEYNLESALTLAVNLYEQGYILDRVKKNLRLSNMSTITFVKSPPILCAQRVHVGDYKNTAETLDVLKDDIEKQGYRAKGAHREIYLFPAMGCYPPEKCHTIVRLELEAMV